jgi:lipopolysaccharide export system protein LptC
MNKVQAQGEHGAQLGWRFVADSSETSTDGMMTTYHHVREGVYYIKGKPAYKLTADQVTVDLRSMNYTGSGSVHVWSVLPRDISDLRTDNLSWNNPMQTLVCPSEVRIKYKGYDMTTSHLQADLLTGSSTLGQTSIKG